MEVEIIVNGGVTLVVIPKNDMEKKLLEQLAMQSNDVRHTTDGFQIVGKTVSEALVISKASTATTAIDTGSDNNQNTETDSSSPNASEEEDL